MFERFQPAWRKRTRELIDSERARPHPPSQVGERLRHSLRDRLARDLAMGSGEPLVPVEARPPRRARATSKTVGSLAASMLIYAPFALAALVGTGIIATGGYLVGRSGIRALRTSRSELVQDQFLQSSIQDASAETPQPAPGEATTAPPAPTAGVPGVAAQVQTGAGKRISTLRTRRTGPAHEAPRGPPPGVSPILVESGVLEHVRAALRAGQSDAALKDLAEPQQIPSRALAEEREALTVMALFQSGRVAEARKRIESFAVRYPKSLYLIEMQAEIPSHEGE